MRTKRLPVRYRNLVKGFPNAGPYPNITGMKKKYYDTFGRESITVICGNSLYHLGYEMSGKAKMIYDIAH